MSKEMTLIVLGILVVVLPYLGIPGSWRTVALVIVGAGVAVTGFLLRGEALGRSHKGAGLRRPGTFIEHAPHAQPEPAFSHEQENITELR